MMDRTWRGIWHGVAFGEHILSGPRTLSWDFSIFVRGGDKHFSHLFLTSEVLEEEKGLEKMARTFPRGAQWLCPGI